MIKRILLGTAIALASVNSAIAGQRMNENAYHPDHGFYDCSMYESTYGSSNVDGVYANNLKVLERLINNEGGQAKLALDEAGIREGTPEALPAMQILEHNLGQITGHFEVCMTMVKLNPANSADAIFSRYYENQLDHLNEQNRQMKSCLNARRAENEMKYSNIGKRGSRGKLAAISEGLLEGLSDYACR